MCQSVPIKEHHTSANKDHVPFQEHKILNRNRMCLCSFNDITSAVNERNV